MPWPRLCSVWPCLQFHRVSAGRLCWQVWLQAWHWSSSWGFMSWPAGRRQKDQDWSWYGPFVTLQWQTSFNKVTVLNPSYTVHQLRNKNSNIHGYWSYSYRSHIKHLCVPFIQLIPLPHGLCVISHRIISTTFYFRRPCTWLLSFLYLSSLIIH